MKILPIPPILRQHPVFSTAFDNRLNRVCRSCRRNRQGAAVVEFAIVAPVFFLLVFGMIEYGRMVMVQQVLTNASREGARRAVLDGVTDADVTTAVSDYLTNASISGATTTVTTTPPVPPDIAEARTVTVTIPFNRVSWLPSPMFLGGKTLQASTTMRRETVH
ncbi:MAG: pilus assembly protein [Pirellulales bacterium]|nr:pilus assembly protein [Pirellulales bacterium]